MSSSNLLIDSAACLLSGTPQEIAPHRAQATSLPSDLGACVWELKGAAVPAGNNRLSETKPAWERAEGV